MQTIGYEICQSARKIYQYLNYLFEPFEITPEQWIIIKALLREDKLSQKELSLRVNKDQNTTKAIVDKLVKKGFIKREDNPQDKRAFILSLTSKAISLAPKLKELDAQMISTLTSEIQSQELENFLSTLKKLKNNISL